MKKSFYFALALTAGLFASCSSDDLTADAPQGGLDAKGNGQVPIELYLGNIGGAQTRGTGTVGTIKETADADNTSKWAGQKFNVYMFEKGTMNLAMDGETPIYNATEFVSPNQVGGINGAAVVLATAGAEIDDETNVQEPNPSDDGLTLTYKNNYFPQDGAFDFWAYRLDGAEVANGTTISEDKVEVKFTIDGSNDIMVAKATPKEDLNEADGTHEEAYYIGTNDEEVPESKVYSAYAARRGIQPYLSFQHLLTRLAFKVKSTKGLSQVYTDPTDDTKAVGENKSAVRVSHIKVKTQAAGTLIAAYKTAPEKRIVWDADDATAPVDLELQQRQRAQSKPATLSWTTNLNGKAIGYTEDLKVFEGTDDEATETFTFATTSKVYNKKTVGFDGMPNTEPKTPGEAEAAGWTEFYAFVVNNPIEYGAPDPSKDLEELVAVTPRWQDNGTIDAAYKTPVGEALLVQPAAYYDVTIVTEQDVPELVQKLILNDTQNEKIYYFNDVETYDDAKAKYAAWATAEFADGEAKTAYDAAITAATGAKKAYTTAVDENGKEVVAIIKSSVKEAEKTVRIYGPKSLYSDEHAPFEANKSYTINITLNGLEDISGNSEIGDFVIGGEIDTEN